MMSFLSRERSRDGRHPVASGVVRPGAGGVPGRVSDDMHSVASIEDPGGFVRGGWRRRPAGRATSRRRSSPSSVVPVLYIGGCQRSGSTLLDRMMSQVSGHVSTGEIVHLWSRGLSANELCGCGQRFLECPFWSDVGRLAFGGWEAIDTERILGLQRRVDRNRYIIFMLLPVLSPISERVEPLRNRLGSVVSSDPPRRWGSDRGFVQARIHCIHPSARSVRAPSHRAPCPR